MPPTILLAAKASKPQQDLPSRDLSGRCADKSHKGACCHREVPGKYGLPPCALRIIGLVLELCVQEG